LVHGFSQDGESKFLGSISYIQEWLNCSRPTVIATLKSLEDKNLIVKEQELVNGVLFNRYRVNLRGSKEILPLVKNLNGGSKEILPNNNIYNNISTSTTPPINNLFDNINKSEEENLICQWLKDDLEIRQLQFKRLGLIENLEDFERVLDEQVAKFYEQCRLDGKGDIRNRGRLEVISHFNNWIKAVTKIKEDDAANRKDNSRSEEEFLAMLGCKC
jgi:DNA-binding MarR family transcriptional regulator